ncbi:MAG: hypothetical protein WBW48_09670 [Anaerolineae bacterium]
MMMKIDHRAPRKRYIVVALFILALLPRVLNLNAFITWDELMWTYLSIKFLTALLRMDFRGTFLVGHPGVITTWAGATGISIQRLLGFGSAADLAWLNGLPTLDFWYPEALRKMAPFLPAAKLPLAMLNAACVVGIYLLARRLFDARIGLLATALLALDPFHLLGLLQPPPGRLIQSYPSPARGLGRGHGSSGQVLKSERGRTKPSRRHFWHPGFRPPVQRPNGRADGA